MTEKNIKDVPEDEGIPINEVKYSLRDLVKKSEKERATSLMGKEMVDQGEIQNFFKAKTKRKKRGVSNK